MNSRPSVSSSTHINSVNGAACFDSAALPGTTRARMSSDSGYTRRRIGVVANVVTSAMITSIVNTVGEDHASLGSDWDGAICPPRDLLSPLDLPRLVEHMLRRRWSPGRIQKILATNYLRVVEAVRG